LAKFVRRHGDGALRDLLGVEPGVASTLDIVAAARRGVLEAAEVVQETGFFLGLGLASMAHVLDPSIIVIGGGMSDAWDLIERPMKNSFRERSMPPVRDIPIVPARLGTDAVLIGAGQLAWQIVRS
jgi:glucokinase